MADQAYNDDSAQFEDEEWRPVPRWEGLYEVSSRGMVRSLDRMVELTQVTGSRATTFTRFYPGKLLNPRLSKSGYLRVKLSRNGAGLWKSAHRLTCEAFCGPAPSGRHVAAHWDGNKTNNVPRNLRWATHSENAADKVRHGTVSIGARNGSCKLTDGQVNEIRSSSLPRRQLARSYGVSKEYITLIRSNVARPIVPVN